MGVDHQLFAAEFDEPNLEVVRLEIVEMAALVLEFDLIDVGLI